MDDRTNTIAGWALAGGILALGLSIATGMIFHSEHPEKPGYPVEGAEEAATGAAEVPIATLLATADPVHGAELFKKCASCHTITQGGANGIGPNLWGTMGEEIGKGKGGFAFSAALSGHGGKWDFETMNAWLTKPSKFAPGTLMTFAGLPNPKDRADIMVYINQQGSPIPLPAAPAAAPAAAGNEAEANAAAPENGAVEGNAAEPKAAH
ncbi:c-type cytochrome [Sphingomonas sp. LB-2]|uniref:c-type cytochrome n=1 Tax=Sphingomonas caeni TaxID=2984949 RepID=UPI00222E25E2|nr:c-type cytochrome [Sphingomonas caeni]MCW3847052.1 c-type cytochrome [Sphingomonas caeni]